MPSGRQLQDRVALKRKITQAALECEDPHKLAADVYLGGERRVNVVPPDTKRAICGVYRAARQAKYARRYLAEAAHRFNRRFRLSFGFQINSALIPGEHWRRSAAATI